MKKLRKLVLEWLFGTDDIKEYMELLRESLHHTSECLELLEDHKETLDRKKWALETLQKVLIICENHGIDVDEEIKHIQLDDNKEVNANETERMEG